MPRLQFPDGARFAFTVMDDTDVATVANARPMYRLLESLGMRTTKTVWAVRCEEGSRNFFLSETLDDPHYCDFVVDLHARGFEIAFHGATMETSARDRTVRALERLGRTFGAPPRVHANHSYNRDNLYWGTARLDDALLRFLYGRLEGTPVGHYQGHVAGSPYWWGDLCLRHVSYVRNLTFGTINVARVNPSMPYHDPARPCVRWWFSAADAEDVVEFNALLSPENVARLEREGGVCIVATHFGKGFVEDGRVHPETRARLEALARRPGWFVPVGTLLDRLRAQRGEDTLPRPEWRAMQWRWARDLLLRVVRRKFARLGP